MNQKNRLINKKTFGFLIFPQISKIEFYIKTGPIFLFSLKPVSNGFRLSS
jgi:hypothetical protein